MNNTHYYLTYLFYIILILLVVNYKIFFFNIKTDRTKINIFLRLDFMMAK